MDRFRDKKWLCKVTNFGCDFCARCIISLIRRAWAVGARLKIERGERGKEKKTPFANIMNTLALHSIHRWRTNSQPFAVKRKEGAEGEH